MTTPQIRIIEGDTVIDRDMNADELIEYEAMQEAAAVRAVADADKASARQAVLNRLGISADEAALLLS